MSLEEISAIESHLSELEGHIAYVRERISRIKAGELAVGWGPEDELDFRVDEIEATVRKIAFWVDNSSPEIPLPGPYFCKVLGGDNLRTKSHDILQDALNELVWDLLVGEGLPLGIEVFREGVPYRTFELIREGLSQYRLIPKG